MDKEWKVIGPTHVFNPDLGGPLGKGKSMTSRGQKEVKAESKIKTELDFKLILML